MVGAAGGGALVLRCPRFFVHESALKSTTGSTSTSDFSCRIFRNSCSSSEILLWSNILRGRYGLLGALP